MRSCWLPLPHLRPTFSQLVAMLGMLQDDFDSLAVRLTCRHNQQPPQANHHSTHHTPDHKILHNYSPIKHRIATEWPCLYTVAYCGALACCSSPSLSVQVSMDKDSCYCSNSRVGPSESGGMWYHTGSYVGYEDGTFYCQRCHRDYDINYLDGVEDETTELGRGAGQSATMGSGTGQSVTVGSEVGQNTTAGSEVGPNTTAGSGVGPNTTVGCPGDTFRGADLPCCPYCGHKPQSKVNDTACTLYTHTQPVYIYLLTV